MVSTFQPGQGRLQHGEVGLAARARERRREVPHVALGRGQLEDQHVLGQPALVARHDARDAQGEALLAEQGVAAIAGAEGPDLARLGELHDVLRVAARPRDVGPPVDERVADRVQRRDEVALGVDELERRRTHPRHDPHVDHDVRRVGDLDAELRDRRSQRAHRERDDVHGAAAHGAGEQSLELGAHLGRVAPVVGRAGVLVADRADERTVLDAGDVARVRAGQERVRTQGRVEPDEGAGLDEEGRQAVPLLLGAVAPLHAVGLRHGRDVLHPTQQLGVAGGCLREPGDGHVRNLFVEDAQCAWGQRFRCCRKGALTSAVHPSPNNKFKRLQATL